MSEYDWNNEQEDKGTLIARLLLPKLISLCLLRRSDLYENHVTFLFLVQIPSQMKSSPAKKLQHHPNFATTSKMLSILRKARLKDKEMRILMLYGNRYQTF